jgi:hypothetical protein
VVSHFQVKGKKVKLKLSLCLTKHHAMKMYWGVEVWLHAFLISALDGGEWSASRLGRFTPRERAPGTHWIGGWVGPRAVLEAVVKKKIPSPHWREGHKLQVFENRVFRKILDLRRMSFVMHTGHLVLLG